MAVSRVGSPRRSTRRRGVLHIRVRAGIKEDKLSPRPPTVRVQRSLPRARGQSQWHTPHHRAECGSLALGARWHWRLRALDLPVPARAEIIRRGRWQCLGVSGGEALQREKVVHLQNYGFVALFPPRLVYFRLALFLSLWASPPPPLLLLFSFLLFARTAPGAAHSQEPSAFRSGLHAQCICAQMRFRSLSSLRVSLERRSIERRGCICVRTRLCVCTMYECAHMCMCVCK